MVQLLIANQSFDQPRSFSAKSERSGIDEPGVGECLEEDLASNFDWEALKGEGLKDQLAVLHGDLGVFVELAADQDGVVDKGESFDP